MSYCLNPACSSPQNADSSEFCRCGARLRLGTSEAPGTARYMAIKSIGQGGFGRTFLAADLTAESKPLCVIKQFFPAAKGNPKAAELFRQEALRLKQLGHHPQIPNLLDYLEQDGQQYLIQEFIDGQNLEQELSDRGAFSELEIRQLLLDLLPVLQFMHNHKVIHRDIKPANIIRRDADNKLVLVDMGAAKYATGTAIAKTGTVIGSAEYTAPEQTRGKAVFASDIYSLGATCIHLLTQMSPFDLFDGSDDRWIWRYYLDQPVSNSIASVLDRMLESATKRRYRSAQDVLQDFYYTNQAKQAASPHQYSVNHSIYLKRSPVASTKVQSASNHPNWSFEQRGELSSTTRSQPIQPVRTQKIWLWAAAFVVISLLFPIVAIHLLSLEPKQPERSPVVSPSAAS
ncbi:MAG: serine/threonine protein kinase [Leptolyngbyaceae cyanobacterium SM1_3_5]|nr:serine/threonine protein kinase [Leptolyngbyaceae cyanobacterium SM1_3_5]